MTAPVQELVTPRRQAFRAAVDVMNARNTPLVVASDGSESADIAVSAARTLARASGAPIQMISVLEPALELMPGSALPPNIDATRAADRLSLIREQRKLAGGDSTWSIEVKFGDPATTIARVAKERGARLIVMGLNPHGRMERALGGDTVFDVMRLGEAPVFIASEKMEEMPRRIVVGVDFGPLSTYAAQLTASLFPAAQQMHLAHVNRRVEVLTDGWHNLPYAGAGEQFAEVVAALPGMADRIQTVEISGQDAARELARYAGEVGADLLVVGSYKRGLFRRIATGGMATRVLRGARCPVLVVPEPAGGRSETDTGVRVMQREALAHQFCAITERNTGRRAVVEIDNHTIGAQTLAFDYAFLGLDYDWHGDTAQLYLGEIGDCGSRHATHTIPHPRSVDVLHGMDGRDQVVRIADGSGQLLVTFW